RAVAVGAARGARSRGGTVAVGAPPPPAGRHRDAGGGARMTTVVDPALVEHLRARAARHPAVAGADIDRGTLAAVVDDLLDDERRILGPDERDALVTAVVDEALG